MRVSSNFFEVLGVASAIERTFHPEEDQLGPPAAVLSHEIWIMVVRTPRAGLVGRGGAASFLRIANGVVCLDRHIVGGTGSFTGCLLSRWRSGPRR